MITRSQLKLAAAAAADTSPEQPFRFLDLPKELRLMVFEELMDNTKHEIKSAKLHNLVIEHVWLDKMYYPEILQVSKLVHDEYWPLCLRESTLWIIYSCEYHALPDEENSEEEESAIPLLSQWLEIPLKVLARVTEIMFKFQADWIIPDVDPFSGIAHCTSELLDLKTISIWSEADMSAVESGRDQADRERRFRNFVESLYLEESALFVIAEDEDRNFEICVDCDMHTPLYEMNKNYHWPRRRHLQQGVAALPGLPEWGYSMFRVAAPWDPLLKRSFTYYRQELTSLRVERKLPMPDRMDTECDSPSEFDYEYDESGWATDWS